MTCEMKMACFESGQPDHFWAALLIKAWLFEYIDFKAQPRHCSGERVELLFLQVKFIKCIITCL